MSDTDRLITAIQELNPTARRSWLSAFSDADLRDYLSHLEFATGPRSAARFWTPPSLRDEHHAERGSAPDRRRTSAA